MTNLDPSLPWGLIGLLATLLTIIDLVLRGTTLWRSARAGQSAWFIVLLVVNSVGLLPAIYLQRHRHSHRSKGITR